MTNEERRKLIYRFWGVPGARLIHLILWIMRLTMRVRVDGGEIMRDFTRRGEGFIGIFWHARLIMIPFVYPGKRMNVLIGTHRDGQIIADVMHCFGFRTVRGSSSKGGDKAVKEMVKLLASNNDLAITPDGPKGPAETLKPGVAQIARLTGKAVVPVAFGASRFRRFRSWDRFIIPYPFSKVVFVIGEPLRYIKGEEIEQFRLRIENALKEATERADKLAGAGL
jgi:lysophospholipid acyltransferase (LPLAT)-like uncharacterized protein